jgi:hypothetical protein
VRNDLAIAESHRTTMLFDRLNAHLYRVLCEVQFAGSLINIKSRYTLEIDSDHLAIVIEQITRQLQAAREIVGRLDEARTSHNTTRAKAQGKAGRARKRSDD